MKLLFFFQGTFGPFTLARRGLAARDLDWLPVDSRSATLWFRERPLAQVSSIDGHTRARILDKEVTR